MGTLLFEIEKCVKWARVTVHVQFDSCHSSAIWSSVPLCLPVDQQQATSQAWFYLVTLSPVPSRIVGQILPREAQLPVTLTIWIRSAPQLVVVAARSWTFQASPLTRSSPPAGRTRLARVALWRWLNAWPWTCRRMGSESTQWGLLGPTLPRQDA